MFKLLTLGILFYFLYRLVFKPKLIEPGQRSSVDAQHSKNDFTEESGDQEGDYIDYEEVE